MTASTAGAYLRRLELPGVVLEKIDDAAPARVVFRVFENVHAAPGAGKMLDFRSAVLMLDHAGTGFAEADDNLVINYENEAGAAASAAIECTGFIDQTADTVMWATPATATARAKTAVENKALVLVNPNDDFTDAGTTTSVLRVKTNYVTLSTGF